MRTKLSVHRWGWIVGVLALGVGACADSGSSISPTADGAGGSIKGEPGLGSQVAAVRAATAKFQDVSVAIAEGYANPAGGTCDQIAIGTMGIHAGNPALLNSQVIDPERPEVLLYLPTGDGFRLVGVEWVQPVLLRDPATNQVAPWFAPGPWPPSYQVLTPTPTLFGHTFQGYMPGHVPGMPWHWDLHAWVWANNPNGMFAQWNPSISCP